MSGQNRQQVPLCAVVWHSKAFSNVANCTKIRALLKTLQNPYRYGLFQHLYRKTPAKDLVDVRWSNGTFRYKLTSDIKTCLNRASASIFGQLPLWFLICTPSIFDTYPCDFWYRLSLRVLIPLWFLYIRPLWLLIRPFDFWYTPAIFVYTPLWFLYIAPLWFLICLWFLYIVRKTHKNHRGLTFFCR